MRTKRIVVILTERPKDLDLELEIAEEVRERTAPEYDDLWWEIVDELPDDIDTAHADQLLATRRDCGDNACFMAVWMREL